MGPPKDVSIESRAVFENEAYLCAGSDNIDDTRAATWFDEMAQFSLISPINQIYDMLSDPRFDDIPAAILTTILRDFFKIDEDALNRARIYFNQFGASWDNVYAHVSSGGNPMITALYIYKYREELGGVYGIKLIIESITNYLEHLRKPTDSVDKRYLAQLKELNDVLKSVIPEIESLS